jgi:hypothetical protein
MATFQVRFPSKIDFVIINQSQDSGSVSLINDLYVIALPNRIICSNDLRFRFFQNAFSSELCIST